MDTINFACWNIGSFLSDPGRNTELVEAALKQYAPDIICFQEFPDSDQLRGRLMACGGYTDHIYHITSESHVGPGWNMGLCVMSRFPLEEPRILRLQKPRERIWYKGVEEYWHDKYFLITGIRVGGRRLRIVTGHSFPFYRYGLDEADYAHVFRGIDSWLRESLEGAYIIGADFNARDALQFMPWVSGDHDDIFAGVSTRPSGKKTDVIAIGREMRLLDSVNVPWELDHHFLMGRIGF